MICINFWWLDDTQAEQESKAQTEDLLAQQFSGKSIDKENVEVLRSLLNGMFSNVNLQESSGIL